jgi:hypothetical protein
MGIFSESSQEDIAAISHIIRASLAFYANENTKRGGAIEYQVNSNERLEFISEAGGKILRIVGFDDALVRAAALVVLCNAAPPFSITKQGKPCLDVGVRKEFLSRFTCLVLHAALSTMQVDRGGVTFNLSWKEFPDETFGGQFLRYLQWIDSMKLVAAKSEKERKQGEEAYLNLLAHITLGCAMALKSCVREEPVPTAPQLPG